MRNVSDSSCRENRNTHFSSITVFRKSCRLWDNKEKYCRAGQATNDSITWRMRIACWTTKATQTLWIFKTYFFSTVIMVARMRLIVTLYVHCLYCYIISMNLHLYRIRGTPWAAEWLSDSHEDHGVILVLNFDRRITHMLFSDYRQFTI